MKTCLLFLFVLLSPLIAPAQQSDTLYRVNEEVREPDTLRADEHWLPGTDARMISSLRSPRAFLYSDTFGDTVTLALYNGKLWLKHIIVLDGTYTKDFRLSTVELDVKSGSEIRLDWYDVFSHTCANYGNWDSKKRLMVFETRRGDVLLDLTTASDTRWEWSDPSEEPQGPSWCSRHYEVRMGPGWVSCYHATDHGSADKYTFEEENCGVNLPEGTFLYNGKSWVRTKPLVHPGNSRHATSHK